MNLNSLRVLVRRAGVLWGLSSRREDARLKTLSSLDRSQVLDNLNRLERLVNDRSALVRRALAETMVRLTRAGAEALTRDWFARRSRWQRRVVQPVDAVVAILRELAADPVATVRALAARGLEQLGVAAEAAEGDLTVMQRDEDPLVRRRARSALARISVSMEIGVLDEDEEGSSVVHRRVARAMAAEGDDTVLIAMPDTLPGLIQALRIDDAQVRINAAEAIGQMGVAAAAAVPVLIEALSDADEDVAAAAAWALGEMGPAATAATPALLEALGHDDAELRERAAEALGKIEARPSDSGVLMRGRAVQVTSPAVPDLRALVD